MAIVGYVILGVILGTFVLLLLLFLYNLFASLVVIEKGTSMVVERFGKFHKRLDYGIHFLIPLADRARPFTWRVQESVHDHYSTKVTINVQQTTLTRIDLREGVMDFPTQEIITRDNVEIKVHPMLLYRITDPVRAVYEVYDLPQAVEKLVQTTLRSIIGDMGLDDTLASREEINRALQQKISRVFLNWGFKLIKVDILEIMPATRTIQEAMHKQISAERVRRAAVISADGFREKTKTIAEGDCAARITKSKGEAQVTMIEAKGVADATLLRAEAEAEALRIISVALADYDIDAASYIVALKYIEALKQVAAAASSRNIYMPFTSDVVGALGALTHPVPAN